MKKRYVGTYLLFLIAIISCSRDNTSSFTNISGIWAFTNQTTQSFAYPSVVTDKHPIGISSWSISSDSINIRFDNSGNYTFSYFKRPIDKGRYTIVRDSLLVIKPDTADFVKFNYSLSGIYATPSPVQTTPSPYSNFHFTNDTIIFKKTDNSSLVFSAYWLTKANSPIIPSNDTLILNVSASSFRKK